MFNGMFNEFGLWIGGVLIVGVLFTAFAAYVYDKFFTNNEER